MHGGLAPVPRPCILVVDDYADATEVWALYLRSAGFEVHTAADGLEAIEYVRTHLPDLVVLDLKLPGCSGIDVARTLQADAAARDVPLIAMTGSADRRELDAARVLFRAVVGKPCDPAVLVTHIRELLPPAAG